MYTPKILTERLRAALSSEDRKELRYLYDNIPKVINKDKAIIFLDANTPYWDMVSVHTLAQNYYHSQNYAYAFVFATLSFERCLQLIFNQLLLKHPDLTQYLGEATGYQLGYYLYTGQIKSGIQVFEKVCTDYPNYIANRDFGGFRLYGVQLFLEDNQVEQATALMDRIIQEAELKENPANEIGQVWLVEYERLKKRTESLKTEVNKLKNTPKENNLNESLSDAFKNVQSLFSNSLSNNFLERARELSENINKDTNSTINDINRSYDHFLEEKERLSGKIFDANALEKIKSQIQKLGALLQHPADGHNPELLKSGILKVDELLARLENRDKEDTMTLLWIKAVCLKRTNEPAATYSTLTKLRLLLEERRNAIKEVNRRAGVFQSFPWFYQTSAEVAFTSNQLPELFNTIEAAKGRNIIDKIALEKQLENVYLNFEVPLETLTQLLKENNSHYLTYFVDEDWSFAVLVCKNGQIRATRIKLGENQLNTTEDKTNPQKWRSSSTGLFGRKYDPTVDLIPFSGIIQKAVQAGDLQEEEHICYCPDGTLHLFPLHFVRYQDDYLAEKFTFSKVHHVYQLIHLLQNKVNQVKNFVVLVAPAAQDQENKKNKFYTIANWVKEYLPNEISTSVDDADIQNINKALEQHDLVHFSTHGVFPKGNAADGRENPYNNSGLLIKDGQVLPNFVADFDYTKCSYLLSPKYITNNVKFRNIPGHASLQACVSGRSKEGYGGDALGLEWALFYMGMGSLLSANWDVDIDFANAFFEEFYRQWLIEKKSKAVAHQKAILKILRAELPSQYPAPYYWGAFTLSGDWR